MAILFLVGIGSAHAQDLEELRRGAGLQKIRQEREMVDFTVDTLDRGETTLHSFKGQVVLLNFWASWCVPCREEMPAMQSVYNRLKDEGFVVVGVNQREQPSVVERFVEELDLTFPILLDQSGRVGSTYGARGLPLTYVVNREGVVVSGATGERDWDSEEMVAYFRALLEQSS
jgi:peroxiredoxin